MIDSKQAASNAKRIARELRMPSNLLFDALGMTWGALVKLSDKDLYSRLQYGSVDYGKLPGHFRGPVKTAVQRFLAAFANAAA